MKLIALTLSVLLWGCALAQAQALHTYAIHEGEGTTPVPCTADAAPQLTEWVNNSGHTLGITHAVLAAFPPEGGIAYARWLNEPASDVDLTNKDVSNTINQFTAYYSDSNHVNSKEFDFAPYYYVVPKETQMTLRLSCIGSAPGQTGGGNVRFSAIWLD